MAVSNEDVEDLKGSTEALTMAARDTAVLEEPKITNEQLEAQMDAALSMCDEILYSKTKIIGMDEDERIVREVMEAPMVFRVHAQIVLKSSMTAMKAVYRTCILSGRYTDDP